MRRIIPKLFLILVAAIAIVFDARAGTIAQQIASIANSKEAIRAAIASKNVDIPASTPLSQYAAKISQIATSGTGGGGDTGGAVISANAGSVILMIGDGMGINHIDCAGGFISTLPISGWVSTAPADCTPSYCITDSAAAATAYACAVKTNNAYLGMTPDGQSCETVAEKASALGYGAVIATSDTALGATPAAFFAHVTNRNDFAGIQNWLDRAQMSVRGDLAKPSEFTAFLVDAYAQLGGKNGRIAGRPFFWMIEEGYIDKESHSNNLPGMLYRMGDFNIAVQNAVQFVQDNPEITLIVTADHETGGLTENCVFTSGDHTNAPVPMYVFGKHSGLFTGTMTNAQVGEKMRQILFQ
ncbi:MAG: alkaline phosphatase [Proteobacteria bacterium]|nr:alkaline phosphatase [Pseudomonadota bacterium]